MDTSQIAKIVGRDPKSVWNWLKDWNIPTRPRGGYTAWRACKHERAIRRGFKHSPETRKKISDAAKKRTRIVAFIDGVHWMKHPKFADRKHPHWKGGISPERQKHYSMPEWKEAVKAVWKRDNATCQKCGLHKNNHRGVPFDIHHIESFENRLRRCEVTNLVLLCEPCHYWVHGKKNVNKEFLC